MRRATKTPAALYELHEELFTKYSAWDVFLMEDAHLFKLFRPQVTAYLQDNPSGPPCLDLLTLLGDALPCFYPVW